jgi:hypothetical protein
VIDIVKPHANQKFLEVIMDIRKKELPSDIREFIYLDKNNTPDKWSGVSAAIKK